MLTKKNDHKKKAEIYTNIGIIYRKHSNYRDAIDHYKKTLQLISKESSTYNFSETLLELGIAYLRIMELDSAKMYLDQGFALNKKFGDKRMEAQLYNVSGNVSKDANEYNQGAFQKLFTSNCGGPPVELEIANLNTFHDEYTVYLPLGSMEENCSYASVEGRLRSL